MTKLKDFDQDFVLLVEGGFVAVSHMDEDAATKLFHGALALRPDHFAPEMGLAAISLYKLEAKKSAKILEKVVASHPDNHRAKALLGVSYLLSGQHGEKGEQLLKEAMNDSEDPATKKLGVLWMDVIEKVIKKGGPAVPKAPKKKEQ